MAKLKIMLNRPVFIILPPNAVNCLYLQLQSLLSKSLLARKMGVRPNMMPITSTQD